MKRLLLALLALVTGLGGTMVSRAARLVPPLPVDTSGLPPMPAIDTAGSIQRLAGAIRYPTVSYASGAPIDTVAFRGFHDHLVASFPQLHTTLTRELIGGLSLLYTWKGSDPAAAPIVLMGHMDVVPVPEPNLPQWAHTPFSGDVAEGFVWGRGTLDDKSTVLSSMEAVETLIRSGYVPPRTIYLTFGHDEEVGGRYGARAIVDSLVARGVKPGLVVDEGGFMASGLLPGLTQRVAIVGIAEKGYISLKLTSRADGGHSSMPPGRTSVGALARAIAALEASPFPMSLDGPTRGMLEAMGPYLPFSQKVVMANMWLTAPLVQRTLAANPLGGALMRTTTSPTMLTAGIKDNVLPPEATGVVNFRIRPGETSESVMARVRDVIADTMITVAPLDSAVANPSPVSSTSSAAWALMRRTISTMIPGEQPPVIPYLVMGGTDAKYWGSHSDAVYRFLPIPLGDGDRERVHGLNERVATKDYASAVTFFIRLLQGVGGL
ncbi:MAG: M20/M25/M40 family metallo-hydrolase [Gemmatimonadetes bacterium]|nr:M20/M25/M40 family metallo-hydrolase [Gemmatimonadota bacterium]